MSSRPSSRATAGEEGTSTLRSSTAKRPLTKPVAPRMSASSTATKPTSTSSARTSSTASSSLSKPPARPTIATTSSVRRPLSTTATSTGVSQRPRPASTSVDASGDESKRDGIAAKPKRMSLAPTASSEKTTTTVSSRTAATPLRKPASATTTSSVRSSVRSPTAAVKTPLTTARPSSTLTSRTRPLSSSTTRPLGSLADKKRLSTIPASPAVKRPSVTGDENKENEPESELETSPPRPALGTRKLTRSGLIEQRIDEFEAVNKMLKSAMVADGMDSDEEQEFQQESKQTMTRLRADLAKVKVFEKDHGRLPSEAELAQMDDVSTTGDATDEGGARGPAASDELSKLREELNESHGQIQQLKSHLAETKARMEYFSQSIEEESGKVQEAAESIRLEHAAQVDKMLALHKSQIEDLEASRQDEIDESVQMYKAELEALQELHEEEMIDKTTELESLRAELAATDNHPGALVRHRTTSDDSDIVKMRTQLEAMRERHQAAKNEAEDQMAKILHEFRQEIVGLKAQHAEKIAKMQNRMGERSDGTSQDDELTREKEAHAETLQHYQAARAELEAVRKSKITDTEVHSKTVKELEDRVSALAKSNTDQRVEHEEQIKQLSRTHEAAQSELKSSQKKNETRDSEAVQMLRDELETVKAANAAHEESVYALQQKIVAITKSSDDRESETSKQLSSLQSQLTSKDEELKTLELAHTERSKKLQADADAARESAIKFLTGRHADEISKLEEQSTSALRDLEELETSHTAYINQVKSDASNEQTQALEEQASIHKGVVTEIEQKLQTMQTELVELRNSHDHELSRLKSSYIEDRDQALATLTTEHEQTLTELKSSSKTSEKGLEVLKATHDEEISKFQSQAKSTSSELDAARFQIQTLKGILQSTERDNQQKEEEHLKELEKRDNDFSQAVGKLSAQSTRIAELETAHKQAVEQAKAAVEAETEASLQALKQEHDEALETLRKFLEKEHTEFLLTLRSEHSSAIESLAREVDTRDRDIESLKTQHSQALAERQSASQSEHETVLAQLKSEHVNTLEAIKFDLQTKHEVNLKDLRDEHSLAISDATKQYEKTLHSTKTEHRDTVTALQSDIEQARMKLADTSELDTLNAQLNASQQAQSKLEEEHAIALASMSKEHANETERLKAELTTLEEEAKKPADTTELDNLKSELAETKVKIAELTQSHVEAIGSKDLEHADAIRALQAELDDAKAAASAAQDSSEADEVKSLLADAKKTITALSEQYTLATMEAENQRLAAESAKKELLDLKKSLSEAKSNSGGSSDSKKVAVKSTKSPISSPNKGGLKASKWATADPEQSSADAQSPGANGQQEGLGIRDEAEAGETRKPKSKKRNVAGQMAGIQEQIRQLTEMNDEFLDDHQKWARSLSRVDDDGTVSISEPTEQSRPQETIN